MPKKDKEAHKKEVSELLELFYGLIAHTGDEEACWASLEALMEDRASLAIKHAFKGFEIDYDEALELIKKADSLTDEQESQRRIILAAVDNIVDFAVAEEFHLYEEIEDIMEYYGYDSEEDIDDDAWLALLGAFSKYNDRYAGTENMDIEYAMSVANYLCSIADNTVLMYMTMGDERVRPWHLQYEGFTAPKSAFPDWLIPPIEHQCRCYLVEDTPSSVIGGVKNELATTPAMPDWFNPTFKESVAKGGRIFSDEHPYFQIDANYIERLRGIAERIKRKYMEA